MTPTAHRKAAAHLQSAHGMSERRACRILGVDRTSVRYQATRPPNTELRERLKALAAERRRFGYRRLHVLLRREGHVVNRKRVQRLYREEKLTVRRRGGRKRAMGTRRPIEVPLQADQRWSLDFVFDQMTDGRRFRILTVIDNCTRECLALVADTSLSSLRVAREMDRRDRRRLALYRAGQAAAERLQRELQRPPARRDAVPLPQHRPGGAGGLAARLQRAAAALQARLADAAGLRRRSPQTRRRGRCAAWRLRTPGSCHTPKPGLRSTPDSTYRWMRNGDHVRWNVSFPLILPLLKLRLSPFSHCFIPFHDTVYRGTGSC